jgi:hypothetical protein
MGEGITIMRRCKWIFLALILVMLGCTPKADVGGTWAGTMNGQNADKNGSTNLEVTLQPTSRGLTGSVTWRNSTGPWGLMEGESLNVTNGSVSGNKVSFVAEKNLPGGSVTANFKGTAKDATTITGTASFTLGSVMGGDTYLGNFELKRK